MNEHGCMLSSTIGLEPFRHNSCSLKDASLLGKPTRDAQFRVGLSVSKDKPGGINASEKFTLRDYDFSSINNLEEKTVAENSPDYKMIVLTRRLKTPGVLETMSEQVPEVKEAFAEVHAKLIQRIEKLGDGDWQIVSHSHSIYNGILVVSYLISG